MAAGGTPISFFQDVLSEARKRADEAEVFGVWSDETPVRFEANKLKEIQGKQSSSVSLRLLKGGRIGFASSSGLDDPRSLVSMALETAPFGAEAKFELPGRQKYPEISLHDPEVEKSSPESMAELGERLISRARAHTTDLLCDATVSKGTFEVFLGNSRGCEVHYRKSVSAVSVEGALIKGEDMLFVGDAEVAGHRLDESTKVMDVVTWQLEMARRNAKVTTGSVPVIFTPRGVASALVAPLAMGFNGRTVLEGASPLKGRLGEKLFDSKLTVVDDPLTPFQPESRPGDDEGVPSRRTHLVEKGVAKSFYYDLQTAGLAGTKSTGNGSRGRGGMPIPGVSSLVFQEGQTSFEDMLSSIQEGLIIEQVIGAEQGNVLGGDFSGNLLLGYKIEKGHVVGRVKDVMVSGNVYQLLKGIVAMGRESRWVHGGGVKTPHIWLEKLSVAAKA